MEYDPMSPIWLQVVNRIKGSIATGAVGPGDKMPGGRDRYWDQVALEYCIKNYQVEVRECTFEDIVEIDTYKDLKQRDSTYC